MNEHDIEKEIFKAMPMPDMNSNPLDSQFSFSFDAQIAVEPCRLSKTIKYYAVRIVSHRHWFSTNHRLTCIKKLRLRRRILMKDWP